MLRSVEDQNVDLAALLALVLSSQRGQEMATRMQQSLELTDALWNLVPVVTAASERYEQRTPADVADGSPVAPFVDADRRCALQQLADRFRGLVAETLQGQPFDESVLDGLSRADLVADPFAIVNRGMDTPAYVDQVLQGMGAELAPQLLGLSTVEAAYLAAYLQAVDSEAKTPALLRALFAAAVGTVEPLVSRMVSIVLCDRSPQAYGSLVDPQLDRDARRLCRGAPGRRSPEAWREALVETLGIISLAAGVDWDALGLLWEARNVVAHRGGIVDSRYSQQSQGEIGSLVASESEAVRAAIDQIGAIRFAIVAGVWDHLTPGIGTEIAQSSLIPLWGSLRAGRWRQAVGLAKIEEVFASDPEDIATAQVNGWLALDQGQGPEAITAQVGAWEVASLPPVYAVARYLLLRQDDQALELLSRLVNEGAIQRASIASWPLFDRARQAGLLSDLMPEPGQ